jgi:hypothetical protein
MTVVTTLDVTGLTVPEYRAVLDELGVETRPEAGIYLPSRHRPRWASGSSRSGTTRADSIASSSRDWCRSNEPIGLQRQTAITVTPLHNFFGPRLAELPGLVWTLPGRPRSVPARS